MLRVVRVRWGEAMVRVLVALASRERGISRVRVFAGMVWVFGVPEFVVMVIVEGDVRV